MDYERPRCDYCGRFISTDPGTIGKDWDCKLIWTGGVNPEPSHDVFWHIKCEEIKKEENKNVQ